MAELPNTQGEGRGRGRRTRRRRRRARAALRLASRLTLLALPAAEVRRQVKMRRLLPGLLLAGRVRQWRQCRRSGMGRSCSSRLMTRPPMQQLVLLRKTTSRLLQGADKRQKADRYYVHMNHLQQAIALDKL